MISISSILGIIALVCFVGLVILFCRMISFTKQKIIDTLRLNRFFGIKRAKDLTYEELKQRVSKVIWTDMKPEGQATIRNGSILREIHPLSAQEGYKYVTVCRDNRPWANVCHVLISTDIAGLRVKPTVVAQTTKDYENMMNIMGLPLGEVFRELKAIDAGDSETKQSVIDRYIVYMMQEIL